MSNESPEIGTVRLRALDRMEIAGRLIQGSPRAMPICVQGCDRGIPSNRSAYLAYRGLERKCAGVVYDKLSVIIVYIHCQAVRKAFGGAMVGSSCSILRHEWSACAYPHRALADQLVTR